MISPAMIAALVFGACGMLAAAALEFLLRQFAEQAGINTWVFIAVPALFAMLWALMLYQDARRKIKRVSQSVSRGLLIAMLTWFSFSLLASVIWCPARTFGQCSTHTLMAAAALGGGPMLAAALVAGVLTGVVIIRPPRQRPEEL
jgi:hypothetical protein